MADKNLKKGFFVFLVIVLIAICAIVFAAIFSGSYSSPTGTEEMPESVVTWWKPKQRGNFIAALHIEGTISEANYTYNQEWLLDTISQLKNDDKNLAIILFVDSPGGTVYESDEAYLALMDYKKSGKPVYAYMSHIAASGGYYISCAADKIFANRNTLTGSIGVIAGQSVDATEFLGKLGIKIKTFTAGRNKIMGNFDAPLTDEQRAIFQSLADEAYDQFTDIVAESRRIPIEQVKKIADGRIYTAKQALSNGLIDQIYTWDETVDAVRKETERSCRVIDYEYKYRATMLDYFSSFSAGGFVMKIMGLGNIAEGIKYPAYIYLGD